MAVTDAGEDEFDDLIKYLDKHSNFLVANESAIRKTLAEGRKESNIATDWLIRQLQTTFGLKGFDEPERLASNFVSAILRHSQDTAADIRDQIESDDLIDILFDLTIEYQLFLSRAQLRDYQGKEAWSSVTSHEIVRNGRFGFDHYISTISGEEIHLTTSLNSLVGLLSHYINQINELMNERGEDAAIQFNHNQLNKFWDEVGQFMDSISAHRDDMQVIGGSISPESIDDLEVENLTLKELRELSDQQKSEKPDKEVDEE